MSNNPFQELIELKPNKEFFIGIDSDGCVFDTMEIKQKECFCPNLIKHYNLQTISKYARDTWTFVNLYSKSRGCNRFIAVQKFFELLAERKEVKTRGFKNPDITALKTWLKNETKLSQSVLEKYIKTEKDSFLETTLEWSVAVNLAIEQMVYGISPFPFVKESLDELTLIADAMVVSQTPGEALTREWKENKLEHHLRFIAGQEYGTKTEHLKYAAKGKYPDDKILMIGDALGDLKAAKSNGVLFFPVIPGKEVESWEKFYKEGLQKFFNGTFKGIYEDNLIKEFDSYLPEHPTW